ncbi:equilibrative nucleoside transporter 3 [Macrosteles quadrilineatus]|uniref:equilibrative nucleoside transporter 3 n=1 Tax=Macrosteles quadrilineatus TaxID=74068 RepID=UPI0023E1EEC7|nr:equilibrative nucleoside transporter 3 [Macrosteles quadrilineatus]
MDTATNTRPLLQQSETDSDFEDDLQIDRSPDNFEDEVVVLAKDTKPIFKAREPSDRFNLAYIIFYFLGTTVLLPWFFFITAAEYWKYKFRPISNNLTSIIGTDLNIDLEASFTPYISIASTVPSTVFLVINPMCSHKIPLCIRMVGSLALMLILFIVTTVFVEINTDAWQDKFFLMTMGIVVLLNIASAVLQSGLFGVVGRFPSRYITAVVSGQALGGVVAALANIVALWVGASAVRSALVYFVMADVFIFFAMLAYVLLSRTMFFKYYMMEAVEYAPVNQPPIVRNISYTGILKKIWVHGFSVFFCFVVSLSMYPAITTLVSSEKKGNNSAWNDVYFVPVVAYLIMSVMDYFGRIFAGLLQLPQKRAWVVGMLSLLRVVFFPLLLLCNAQPRHHLPVLIHSDILYILIVVMFGFTNGYLANITMICVPKIVELHEQEVASSMMAAFLGVGLACGSFLSLLMVNII